MSTPEVRSDAATSDANVGKVDLKLEAVVIPVSDADRAKEFYASLGWRLDADFAFDNGFRLVQFTPPGSGCSVQFGTNMTSAAPGSARGLYLIVSDIEAARDELDALGAGPSEVFHAAAPGAQFQPDGTSDRVSGPAPDHRQLLLLRHVQRPGRQRLAAAGGDDAAARPDRRRGDHLRIHRRPGQRAPACGGRPRRTRAAHRGARRQLAGLVRRLHGGRAVRRGTADVTDHVATARGAGQGRRGDARRARAGAQEAVRPADASGAQAAVRRSISARAAAGSSARPSTSARWQPASR